jgi:hypothetical protein
MKFSSAVAAISLASLQKGMFLYALGSHSRGESFNMGQISYARKHNQRAKNQCRLKGMRGRHSIRRIRWSSRTVRSSYPPQ